MNSKGKDVGSILIIDFKMKFEEQFTRESTVEHFEKREIAWHNCALIYYLQRWDVSYSFTRNMFDIYTLPATFHISS